MITLGILTILGMFLTLLCWALKKDILTLIFLGIVIGLFIGTMFVSISMTPSPTAMDVYRNKTELQYTIRGNEIIDSVVVFKKRIESCGNFEP